MIEWRAVAGILLICGCAQEPRAIEPQLEPMRQAITGEQAADFEKLSSRQARPYAAIAKFALEDVMFRFENNSRQLELSQTAARLQRFPQIRPSGQISTQDGAGINISVDQVIYDGGVYPARLFLNDAEAIGRQIEILNTVNDMISEDVALYLSYHQNRETESLFDELQQQIAELLELARTRVQGGVGAANEVTLFQLRLTEVQTEARIARSRANVALSSLRAADQINLAGTPPSPVVTDDQLPPRIVEAVAARELERGRLELERTNVRPQIVVSGTAGSDLTSGVLNDDIGVRVRTNNPLPIYGNPDLRLAEENLVLAEAELDRTVAETQREVAQLREEISLLRSQARDTGLLTQQAQARLEDFADQFRAGTVGITEAASLVDTLQRALRSEIQVRYDILDRERQLAEMTGSFLP